ncbi:hypothetical protein [Chromohalobacter canadensis]|uniref:Uncharacterized protein n=1 Tax=Chromohalobacter canadensis TaxID=141389 RepID=A0A285VR09_9GAMM|nr:hypothetical protein [Chromohalobacter canadensis]SOC56492.1 hypothetical protein SAMN05421509_10789 [Chromohalobacter canadensis]
MDDELWAITADLDSVLYRLANHMSSDKLKTQDVEPQCSNRVDAARVVMCSVTLDEARGPVYPKFNIERAIHISRLAKEGILSRFHFEEKGTPYHFRDDKAVLDQNEDSKLSERTDAEHENAELADLLTAMRALVNWRITGWPLEDEHMESLICAVESWANREGVYIGEAEGLPLTPKRQIDRRRWLRERAAWSAYSMHMDDPKANPVDENLFEQAGERFSMSASVVKRAYYSDRIRQLREEVWPRYWSETGEN